MTVLTDAIFFAGTYDQLNLASLACFETLCLRVAQLVEAYAGGDPSRPNWAGVKHFHLAAGPLNVVPKVLRSHAHRLAKEEVEIENLRIKAAGGKGVAADVGEEGGLPQRPTKPGDKASKGDGKGDKQRQLAGSAAADSK